MSHSRKARPALVAIVAAVACSLSFAGTAGAISWPKLKPLTIAKPAAKPATQTPIATTTIGVLNFLVPSLQLPVPQQPPAGALGASPLQVLTGNAAIVADPAYWAGKWERLTQTNTFTLPWPADLVKPELVLPSARVARGDGSNPWLIEGDAVDVSGVRYVHKGITRTVGEFLKETETDGLVFMRDGKLVADYYANGYNLDQPHQPWSVTKSFISAAVGIARDEGHIGSLETPIEHFIPELRGTNWQGTTIYNLFTMQSGIHWEEGTPVLPQNTQVQQWVQVWLDYVTKGAAGQDRNEFLASLPRDVPQGAKFSYNSGNTQVLAWMLEKIYGKPFNEILSQKLWKPAGMSADASIITDRHGNAIASQGLYATPYDFARFGELFRRDGLAANGTRIVSSDWARESTTFTSLSGGSYAYQWWSNFDADGFSAGGFQGNAISVSRTHCTVGVRLSHTLGLSADTSPSSPFDITKATIGVEMGGGEFDAAFAAVSRALGGCPAS